MSDPLLPDIVSVEAARVHYEQPRAYYVGRDRRQTREAAEIVVRTSEELPIADVTPALFVGEVPLAEYTRVGPNKYKFYAFEFQKLEEGAAIALGWPELPSPRVKTKFQYRIGGGPAVV
jgi:hypothetical protein